MKNEGDHGGTVDRRWERFRINVRVSLALTRDAAKFEFIGTAHDISIGGMAMFVPNELRVGELMVITFTLPYSKGLNVNGVVRNRQGFEYGVEFRSPSAETQAELERNCRALALLDAGTEPER